MESASSKLEDEEIVSGSVDKYPLPPILRTVLDATRTIEIRGGQVYLNCRHPLTEEGIEPPKIEGKKPWLAHTRSDYQITWTEAEK